jgi:transglutaminase-like putative cysteine protease
MEGLADKIDMIRRYYTSSLRYAQVRAFAEKSAMSKQGKPSINALFAALRSFVRYVPDPVGVELIKAPWVMIDGINKQGWTAGDCDDFASLGYALLRNVGVPAQLAVAWYGDATPRHIFDVVPMKSGASMLPFDLVAPNLGVTKTGTTKVVYYA